MGAPETAGATAVIDTARQRLAALEDPRKAVAMQRYTKSELPFRGVPAPRRRALARQLVDEFRLDDRDE